MSRRGQEVSLSERPWRFYFIALVLGLLAAALLIRMAALQLLDSEQGQSFLQSQGDARAVRYAAIPAHRGAILDRNGVPLAVSTPVVSLILNPQHFDRGRLGELAQVLNESKTSLADRLAPYASRQFMYLRRNMTPEAAAAVLDMNFRGISAERGYRRFYPAADLTAQLVGLTDLEDQGLSGLELAFDEVLRGSEGRKKYIKDRAGRAVRDVGLIQAAADGDDIRLSIDLRMQYVQFRALQEVVETTKAKSASAITLNPKTGEVLAVSNYPSFNPNDRSEIDSQTMRNRVFVDQYEPGSTFKALTAVAAIETGEFTPESVIDTAPGWTVVQGKTFKDPVDYGELTLAGVLAKSSQVGTTHIALEIGREPLMDVLRRFGVGRSLSVGFPGESSGVLPMQNRWSDIEQATLAFGYGLTVSPAQLAHFYSVFANQGRQATMTLLRQRGEPESLAPRVISEDVAEKVKLMLGSVAAKGGTGILANVSGYQVAGKTGTVHKAAAGGYDRSRYIAWFAGMAPADSPQLVSVVMVDEPKGESVGGGSISAPVFADMTESMLRVMGRAPHFGPVLEGLAALNGYGEEGQDG